MIHIKEAIIVEGRYDSNTLHQIVDAVIIETGGFRIFNDKERLKMIRKIAQKRGILILTDSDGAGFVIRNFLKGAIPANQIKHAYIPDIFGKEHRKRKAGKEGKIGVEGMRPAIIVDALRKAGAAILEDSEKEQEGIAQTHITKSDFYAWGLSGRTDSAARRKLLLQKLQLPEHMTANALLQFINAVADAQTVAEIIQQIDDNT